MASDYGLRKTFREYLVPRGFDAMAVETRGVSVGAPDANYCKRGVEVWVEHKRIDERYRVTIRPAQVGWIERRLEHGGRVFVAARTRDELLLYHGNMIRELQELPVTEVRNLGRWRGRPSAWDWHTIEGLLMDLINL